MQSVSISSIQTARDCLLVVFNEPSDWKTEGGNILVERSTTGPSSGFSQVASIAIVTDSDVFVDTFFGSYQDVNVSSGTTYWYRIRREKNGQYTSYSSAVSATPVSSVYVVTNEWPFNIQAQINALTKVRDGNNTSGVSQYASLLLNNNFGFAGQERGCLELKLNNTSGANLGRTYCGARKPITNAGNTIIDLDFFFCMEYYSGDPNNISASLNINKLDYYMFEVYTKKNNNIYKTRLRHSYFSFSSGAYWQYLDSDNSWVDIDGGGNRMRLETFTHFHQIRIKINTNRSIPELEIIGINGYRVEPGCDLVLDNNAGGPANNGEFHFVMMICAENLDSGKYCRGWISYLRHWPNRGYSSPSYLQYYKPNHRLAIS